MEQLQIEALFTREVLRISEECVDALDKLNQTLVLCIIHPGMVSVAQQHLISALESNQAITDLCQGRANMLGKEYHDGDV